MRRRVRHSDRHGQKGNDRENGTDNYDDCAEAEDYAEHRPPEQGMPGPGKPLVLQARTRSFQGAGLEVGGYDPCRALYYVAISFKRF
ncbi:hypothetical protein TAMC210_18400 [Thermanaeromonas sp. C210]|nr:hypothetical protein TAMC210_18400 [Thermanaeromonas sp. C210]